jgi:hypothetical protein
MIILITTDLDMITITDHWNIVVVFALNLTQEMMESVEVVLELQELLL